LGRVLIIVTPLTLAPIVTRRVQRDINYQTVYRMSGTEDDPLGCPELENATPKPITASEI
jgi:hypothetical protein